MGLRRDRHPHQKTLHNIINRFIEQKRFNPSPNDYYLYQLVRHQTPGMLTLQKGSADRFKVWHMSRAGKTCLNFYKEDKDMIKKYLETSVWVIKNPTIGRARAWLEETMNNKEEISILLDKINEFYSMDKQNIETKQNRI